MLKKGQENSVPVLSVLFDLKSISGAVSPVPAVLSGTGSRRLLMHKRKAGAMLIKELPVRVILVGDQAIHGAGPARFVLSANVAAADTGKFVHGAKAEEIEPVVPF